MKKPRARKSPTLKEMMGQGTSPTIGAQPDSVSEQMGQGKAKKFPGQGQRSVKSLMHQ